MHGQYGILSEILLFAIGLSVASYVTLSFGDVRDFVGATSTHDKLVRTSNELFNYITKAAQENSVVAAEIPTKISEKEYTIRILDEDGETCEKGDDCFLNLTAGTTSVSRQLFNISQNYNIKGDIHSSAKFITIRTEKKEEQITIGRE